MNIESTQAPAPQQGTKNDAGKLRYDLLPGDALAELVRVYTIGAKKYADRNWEQGIAYGRIFAAMNRHAWAWWGGEQLDPVDGQHHLSSVAWCALALLHFDLSPAKYFSFDDRSNPGPLIINRQPNYSMPPAVDRSLTNSR